jgi:hypothetical protein
MWPLFGVIQFFFDPVWCSSFVVALEMESAIFFLHLSLLSNLVLVAGLKNQLSPYLLIIVSSIVGA